MVGPMQQRAALLLLGLVGSGVSAQSTSTVTIVAPAAVTSHQPIPPGQVASLSFTLRNDGATPETADLVGALESSDAVLQQYQFTSMAPDRCRAPVHDASGVFSTLSFVVGPLAADETLTCTYQITRSAVGDSGRTATTMGAVLSSNGVSGSNVDGDVNAASNVGVRNPARSVRPSIVRV